MAKTLAVVGATGRQGGAVLNYVLDDPELSKQYTIRAITRDANSEKAKQLGAKVDVVSADLSDRASLEKALAGVHTIYIVTTPAFGSDAAEDEFNRGKTIADVAVAQGVQYIIFSTLPATSKITGGKYTKVTPFDAKAKIEAYIRGLPIKSAFYAPGYFLENFEGQPFLAPKPAGDGTWVIERNVPPETEQPWLDAVGDGGKFVGAILADPDKFEGKTLCAGTHYTLEQIAAILSKATGKTIAAKQIPNDEFEKGVPWLPEVFSEAFRAHAEFGYWGPDSKELAAWATENARGKLTTPEEFFAAHPLQLS